MATREQLEAELIRLKAELNRLDALEAALNAQGWGSLGIPNSGDPKWKEFVAITAKIGEINARIVVINEELLTIPTTPTGPASAGNLAQDDNQATTDNARTQAPTSPPQILDDKGRIIAPPDTTSGSNAQISPTPDALDFGTDAPVRPGVITQGTAGQTQTNGIPTGQQPGNNALGQPTDPVPGNLPGAFAGSDDGVRINTTQQEIDVAFGNKPIVATDNILNQYGSYTYVASVYLMTKEASSAMFTSKKKNLNGSQLLFQTGGAPVGGRNQFFTNDYYIETIQLDSVIAGKGSGWSHNVNHIKMTVVEPNGITFLGNLEKAVNSYLGTVNQNNTKKINYQSELYLLVIRFYGYDDAGNLVRGGVATPDGSSDPNAFVEKWYPFRINNIRFKVGTKLVQYDIEATVAQYDLGGGSTRGSIPYNLELGGRTVKDILTGPTLFTSGALRNPYAQDLTQQGLDLIAAAGGTVPTPEKANAAPTKDLTIKQGLITAMNEYQSQLVSQGYQDVADVYEVVFDTAAIANAQVRRGSPGQGKEGGKVNKSATAMAQVKTAAGAVDPKKSSMDPTTRIEAIVAGQQIVTVIDQVVRNSTYIQDQQLYIVNEQGKTVPNPKVPNAATNRDVAWFKISFSAERLDYDTQRKDYAYRMRFTVSAYKINNAPPPWFPQPIFNGVHKQYNHWFTGLNTQVLDYEQTYNSQYALVMSGGLTKYLNQFSNNANDLQKFAFSPRSSESSQGAEGRTNEPAAAFADYLYNPGDLGRVDMKIIGDPAWLQQGEAFAGLDLKDPTRFNPFLADGTINFDSQEVLFEVLFNKPVDYDLNTGLMDPGRNNYNSNRSAGQAGDAQQSYIYKATKVTSNFEKGKFTQRLQGVNRVFPIKAQQSAAQYANSQRDQAVINNSVQRGGVLSPSVLGPTLSTPPYIINPSNPSNTGDLVSNTVQRVLGGTTTRPFTPPYVPTSSGQPVGTVNTPTIDPTTGQPISANERVVGADATPDINTQIGAPDDDAGYDPGNYSSSEESLNRDFGNGITIEV